MEKTKRIAFILFAVAGVALAIALVFSKSGRDDGTETATGNVYVDLPEAEDVEIPESKSVAYMRGEGKAKIEDYWNDPFYCKPQNET